MLGGFGGDGASGFSRTEGKEALKFLVELGGNLLSPLSG